MHTKSRNYSEHETFLFVRLLCHASSYCLLSCSLDIRGLLHLKKLIAVVSASVGLGVQDADNDNVKGKGTYTLPSQL